MVERDGEWSNGEEKESVEDLNDEVRNGGSHENAEQADEDSLGRDENIIVTLIPVLQLKPTIKPSKFLEM